MNFIAGSGSKYSPTSYWGRIFSMGDTKMAPVNPKNEPLSGRDVTPTSDRTVQKDQEKEQARLAEKQAEVQAQEQKVRQARETLEKAEAKLNEAKANGRMQQDRNLRR